MPSKTIRISEEAHNWLEFWRAWYNAGSFSEAILELSAESDDKAEKAWQRFNEGKQTMTSVVGQGTPNG